MRIEYHRDARGPAINVKVYHLDSATTTPQGTDFQRMRAWNGVHREWWAKAGDLARAHAFRDVASCGRSGGWLYTVPLPDSTEDGGMGDYPELFVDSIKTLLEATPSMFRQALEQVIQEDAAEAAAPDYYVQRIPVLSTAHIQESTAALLKLMAAACPGDVVDLGEGFMVYVGDAERTPDRFSAMPPDMQAVIAWYDKAGFHDGWIRLDGGIGSVIAELPQYDW
jgi:hypothetical protein